VQHEQLNTFVRTGLPALVFGQCGVGKHGVIQAECNRIASDYLNLQRFRKVVRNLPDGLSRMGVVTRFKSLIACWHENGEVLQDGVRNVREAP
jgi:hypothetical protein